MSIKVIVAGLPRTGTNTMKTSLEMLGFGKAYHMKELLVHPNNVHFWQTLKSTGTTDWNNLYEGYQATVDFPAYPWYKQHMKQYPDAKVILTVRPFEKWYTSIYSTIWQSGPQTFQQKMAMMSKMLFNARTRSVVKCIKLAKEMIFEVQFQKRFEDKVFAEEVFNKHNEDVKAYVPAEKLLVFDVTEGWEPLCDFLGVPEPDEPFPHLNKKENFKVMVAELMRGNMV